MIPRECKRLAEVDFPIAVVSKHSAKEKSIRHGHPSTLHLWWARRPLAACRAMLLGLLLPDPCDPHCPEDFKKTARELLPRVQGDVRPKDEDLRAALLKFIGDFANWDVASDRTYLEVSRGLVKAAHGEETPLVVDPFAGGGSIPLEALRLGCEVFASDLNPVACLILKTMLEDIPRHGPNLAEELRRVGAQIKQAAEKELAEFYPIDSDGARPIAYLWARTVRCESPNCGAEIPLIRSFWLCKKANRRRALKYKVIRSDGATPRVEFEICQPETENEVSNGTVNRAKATCVCCNIVLPPDRVRAQLREQRGGADAIFNKVAARGGGALLLVVVTLKTGEQGRLYRLPTSQDYSTVWKARKRLEGEASKKLPNGSSPVPDETTPAGGGSGAGRAFSIQNYGMMQFGDLFTARQKLALLTLRSLIANLDSVSLAAKEIAAVALSRFTDISNALCRWENTKTQVRNLFTRQALPMIWDFAEPSLFGEQAGDYTVTLGTMIRVMESIPANLRTGQTQLADASESQLPAESTGCWFTDPPYYDAIPYSDLSDFFFVWLKRVLPNHPLLRDPFDLNNPLTPKQREAVQDETKKVNSRVKDRAFFEEKMAAAFAEGRRVLKEDGVGCVVFAHKTTEGWEALLSGMIRGGWVITASWPIVTESGTRLRAKDSAALSTSVHLVCRPRTERRTGDWSEVLRELPNRVRDWIDRLQSEGVRGADLVFACIGPALEIFSRYSRVETAEGREVKLPEFLEKVWEVVGRTALEQILGTAEGRSRNDATGVLEEDSRLTALFLWTLQSTNQARTNGGVGDNSEDEEDEEDDEEDAATKGKTKGFTLIFDVARRFAQPLGIHLEDWENRIIQTQKGVVRLLSIAERAKQLFGEEGAGLIADRLDRDPTAAAQLTLFPEARVDAAPRIRGRRRSARQKRDGQETGSTDVSYSAKREATTLDRVHAAMVLQSSGRANALRTLLNAEQNRGPDFLHLANALSALYPKESEEKRLLDAMLLAVPR
jgi:putative DNA methylase